MRLSYPKIRSEILSLVDQCLIRTSLIVTQNLDETFYDRSPRVSACVNRACSCKYRSLWRSSEVVDLFATVVWTRRNHHGNDSGRANTGVARSCRLGSRKLTSRLSCLLSSDNEQLIHVTFRNLIQYISCDVQLGKDTLISSSLEIRRTKVYSACLFSLLLLFFCFFSRYVGIFSTRVSPTRCNSQSEW